MKRFLIIVLAFCYVDSCAQEKGLLTFSDAVKIALENNIALRQSENQLDANQAQKLSDMAGLAPSISFNGNLGRRDGNSFNQNEGRVVNGQLDFASGTLNTNMTLIGGFSQLNRVRQSSAQVEAQLHGIKRSKQDVIRNVANQYLQCLLDEEVRSINEQNLEAQKTQLTQIITQVETGSIAKVDQYNQEFQVKNAELLFIRSGITLRNDKATLAEILQIDPSLTFDVGSPAIDVNSIVLSEYNLDELYQLAIVKRSDLLQTQKIEEASKYDLKSSRGQYYPTVGAFFNYGSAYNQVVGTPDSLSRSFDQQFFTDNVVQTYGLSINVPIFSGFSQRNQVVRSRVNYENAKLTTQGLSLTVKSDVLRAYQSFQDAVLNYKAAQAQLDAGEISFDLEKERFELGVSDLVAYTQANQNYRNAQATFAQAKYTLLFQDILLQYSVGTLQIEDVP